VSFLTHGVGLYTVRYIGCHLPEVHNYKRCLICDTHAEKLDIKFNAKKCFFLSYLNKVKKTLKYATWSVTGVG